MLGDTTTKKFMTKTNLEVSKPKKRRIVIKNNHFSNGDTCVRIKGMNKRRGSIEELDIQINDNEFNTMRGNGVYIDRISAGVIEIKGNKFITFNTISVRLCDCKSSKQDIMIENNNFSSIYQIGVCIDSSIVSVINNTFTSSTCGIYVYLQATSGSTTAQMREEILDSHKDIYYRELGRDSFMGASNTHLLVNVSLFAEPVLPQFPCRVIIRNNKLKQISKYGVIIQNNSAGSIKVQDCVFLNAKEPVVINEKDDYLSKNTTKNFLMHENSELLGQSLCGTPRASLKGTIVVKNNRYDGSSECLVRKHVKSYLYDINNTQIDS